MSKEIQGIWISEITFAVKDLSWSEKALLEKMNLLDKTEKGCFASNQFLGDFLGIKKQSAANMVTSLTQRNYLDRIWTDGHNRGYRSTLHHPKLYYFEYGSDGKRYLKKYGSDEKPYSNEEGSAQQPYSNKYSSDKNHTQNSIEPYSNQYGNHTQNSIEPYYFNDSEPYSNEEHSNRDKDEYLKRGIDISKEGVPLSELSTSRESESWNSYLENIQKGIGLALNKEDYQLPSKWTADIRQVFNQKYSSAQFVQCFQNLNTDGRIFPITSQNILDALPFLKTETNWQTVGNSDEEISADSPEEFHETKPLEPLKPVSLEDQSVWQGILEKIKEKLFISKKDDELVRQVFDGWFKPIVFEGVDEQAKTIKLYSAQVNKSWVIEYYSDTLCTALEAAGMGEYTFDWGIEESKFEAVK